MSLRAFFFGVHDIVGLGGTRNAGLSYLSPACIRLFYTRATDWLGGYFGAGVQGKRRCCKPPPESQLLMENPCL